MKDVIVIPTYNERENVGTIIPLIFKIAPEVSVLVVDDSSPDGTASIIIELQKQYKNLFLLSQPVKNGLGSAYINGFSHILKEQNIRKVVMMDADLSHDPKYLPQMFEEGKNYSIVIGSRYINGGKTIGWEYWRKILSFLGNLYCRVITGMPVHDCTGGFNVISADLLRKIDFSKIDMSGYAFIMEIKYLLYKAGGTFFEVPIIFKNRLGGESKISSHIISEGILAPWKMRWKNTKKK